MTDVEHTPGKAWLPPKRAGQTLKFGVQNFEGYLVTGEFDTGLLGEIFIYTAKQGSTLSGWADAFAIAFSGALQWSTDPQATLDWLIDKLCGLKFDPHGVTGDPEHVEVRSVIEHAMLQLRAQYPPRQVNNRPRVGSTWVHKSCGNMVATPSGSLKRAYCRHCQLYASDIEEVTE